MMTILQSFIFDVIMGSFKNAKLCKLVGLYLFSKISVLIDSDNGSSYRNNGLAAIYSANTTKLGRQKNNNCSIQKRSDKPSWNRLSRCHFFQLINSPYNKQASLSGHSTTLKQKRSFWLQFGLHFFFYFL